MTATLNSIYDLQPIEKGGVVARTGFTYQDHVSVAFCLDMIKSGSKVIEIWCESQDDITILYGIDGKVVAEFVQVKTTDENLWSVAIICKREKKTKNGTKIDAVGTSILERSLAYDRCSEKTLFRIVTVKDVDSDLKVLKSPIGSPNRSNIANLHAKVKGRIDDFKSMADHDYVYWLDNTYWEVRGYLDAIKNDNFREITKYAESVGMNLKSIEVEIVYELFLARARAAAEANAGIVPQEKKLKREEILSWTSRAIQDSLVPENMFDVSNGFTVSWGDLREVIENLHPVLTPLHNSTQPALDFSFVEIEVKNALNGLSETLFKMLQQTYEPYFDTIQNFLSLPQNEEIYGLYSDIVNELNIIIAKYSGSAKQFDQVLGQIYSTTLSAEGDKLRSKKRLIWVLISFMYFNCDIGLKK